MRVKGLKIDTKDQVITLVETANAGEEIEYLDGQTVCYLTAENRILQYHKAACRDIPKGSLVYKYGQIIGVAAADIRKGEWVHTHNLVSECMADSSEHKEEENHEN